MALAGPQLSSYAVCYFSSSLPKIAGQRFSTVGMPVFIGQSVVKFPSVGKQRFLRTDKNKRKGGSGLLVLFPGRVTLTLLQTTPVLEDLCLLLFSENSLSHSETQLLGIIKCLSDIVKHLLSRILHRQDRYKNFLLENFQVYYF